MLHALHGNSGLPEDLLPLLHTLGAPFRAWHLWQWLADHPEGNSFTGVASSLNDAAAQEPAPRVLLGYSLGARLALHALTQQPAAWDAAVLISAHPGLTTDKERATRLVQDQSWAVRFLREPWDGVMAAWNAQPALAGEAVSPANQRLVETWRREVASGCNAWSLGRQENLRPRLREITCPVLWITGAKDTKFTSLAAECWALLPRARHCIVPDAGHRVHLDQPEAVRQAIAAHLGALTAA
jgi:2-succinyl-6-hydroxy-2,4-cyclohexadiene-1-carboxylate synthase